MNLSRMSLRYPVTATFSYDGSNPTETPLGERFWYSPDRAHPGMVDPAGTLEYHPYSDYFTGIPSMRWMIEAPPARKLGDTLELHAGLWNRPPCNVTWTYKVECH